jgi:cyclophilin family peptidyl-prolyl cis-trans isomerase
MLRPEFNAEPMTAGGRRRGAGAESAQQRGRAVLHLRGDQPTLQGQYTVFGRVADGLDIVQEISATAADAAGPATDRIVIKSITIRDTPPPVKDPLVEASAAELAAYHAVLETTKGEVELQFLTDKALGNIAASPAAGGGGRLRRHGVHRIVSDFVIQTARVAYRDTTADRQAERAGARSTAGVFRGAERAGRGVDGPGEDPASGNTSFFICTGSCRFAR